jgi:Fe-S cluster assembly protein SufD
MSSTLQAVTDRDAYVTAFTDVESSLARHSRPAVQRLRRAAIASFGEIGFPSERHEDWKFTNLAPYLRTSFLLSPTGGARSTIESGSLPAGVLVMKLDEALEKHPELVERHLGQHADFKSHPFVALNTAFWRDGAFVYVPPDVVVEEPIRLTHQTAPDNEDVQYLHYRRVLLVLGRCSQATVVEEFDGSGGAYAINTVSEVVLEDGAHLDHYKVQEESPVAFHLACTKVTLSRDSNLSTQYIGLGGRLVRNEVRILFTGENAEATVNGLYRATGTQHADNHTVIDHAKPHCASHELYKGILDGKARGVFNGKIYVRQDAQKTDAKQTNQTLLLSANATINTKPQLEIFADDVKCTHGATVGQLDDEQLFYLRTRGIALTEARNMLTVAFANDVIGRIKIASLRDRLEQTLLTDVGNALHGVASRNE